jgi:hypothetical protein
VNGFVIPLGGEFGPALLDPLREAGLLPADALWWFALAEDELVLPSRCDDLPRVFARPWERVSLFGPRAELRWQARGRHGSILLLLEAERPPDLPLPRAGQEARFPVCEPGIHLLWGEKQHLGNRRGRGQVGFPRPLDYLADEPEAALEEACVLDVWRYSNPGHARQALRYAGVSRRPRREWARHPVEPFPEALAATNTR